MIIIEKMNIVLSSATVEVNDNKNYLEVTNRVCYYDEPNANDVVLPYDDNALEFAKTLIDMPIQAMYTVNEQGEPDLLDHCVSMDEEGNYTFGTISIGVHTDVWIANDEITTCSGQTKTLPCLFAKQKIWKRYPNYIAAIVKLFNEGSLHNSWEITSFEYTYKNGIKTLTSYVFDGNAYLGSNVEPAYGASAEILDISQKAKREKLMVASVLAQDISNRKEDKTMENEEVKTEVAEVETENEVETTQEKAEPTQEAESAVTTETSETADEEAKEETVEPIEEPASGDGGKQETEIASLTINDLYNRLTKALEAKVEGYVWIEMLFPEEKEMWFKGRGLSKETEIYRAYYTVEGDEVQLIGDIEKVELVVKPAEMANKLTELSQTVIEAQAQIAQLSDYKEKYDKLSNEIATKEKDELKARLQSMVDTASCLTNEDKVSAELLECVDNADEQGVKLFIANKYIQSMSALVAKDGDGTKTTVNFASVNDDNDSDFDDEARAKAISQFINS